MLVNVLKSKIHYARITEAVLEYEGSITIDRELMDKAGLYPHERVLVSNMQNGSRLETYVIEGERNSGIICLNGAAARLGAVNDKVTIMAFGLIDEKNVYNNNPKIIILDNDNKIKSTL